MDVEKTQITVAKLDGPNGPWEGRHYYMMIGWHPSGFDMYLYFGKVILKGRFTRLRMLGFSKNLSLTESEYYKSLKQCLSEQRPDYCYELKDGFFYWKRKVNDDALVIEGFLPVEIATSETAPQPGLLDILLALNKHLKLKVNELKTSHENVRAELQKCLSDTQEFLNLKLEMEKALSAKFTNLLTITKNEGKGPSSEVSEQNAILNVSPIEIVDTWSTLKNEPMAEP